MPVSAWFIFTGIILVLLAIDLGLFHRKSHQVSFREALGWTIVWVILSCVFGGWVWSAHGQPKAVEFFTGYLIELSLSADNVFVFALVFNYFAVPQAYQHKVLFWGILSALVLRFIMIMAGAALIINFSWIIYIFAAFLIITAIKMLVSNDEEVHPENNPVVRWFKKAVPTTSAYEGDRFIVKRGGLWMATPLLVVLVCVEVSDVIFAVDSIPAIFAVTQDPFIVFTSNVCAILGLRSLYFVLAGVMNRFIYLKTGLALVLGFVGIKMLLSHTAYKIDSLVSLSVVALILAGSVVASLWATRKKIPDVETKNEQPLAG